MNNSYIWDKTWAGTEYDRELLRNVKGETDSVRGRKVISYIEKHLGNIGGLKIIEVGSGGGVYSLILARRGATLTLMDYSEEALSLAKKYFESCGTTASFLRADALNPQPRLQGEFDVAMSFGTVEHFRYPKRFLIAKAHMDLVRPGGIVIISVPNILFFPHEILKFYLQRKGKWQLGYEGAFMRQELFQLGNKLGLENIQVHGSAFITDTFRYFHIFQGTRLFKRFCQVPHKYVSSGDLASPFDDLLGAAIFLIGYKPYDRAESAI
ncbi:MAG: methyltransferase domain-containing protein [Candidatus Omnitrophica bacterium]|nr:methyltransferase domain-containing protein [Candidatus Omnitrophota bacterium]